MRFVLLWALFLGTTVFCADDIQFRAQFYERDAKKNKVLTKGKAWLKKGEKEVWADEILIDYTSRVAYAKGNVHIKDGRFEIWCDSADYNLDSEEAVLQNATLTSGPLFIYGKKLEKKSKDHFLITEGEYSNCNIEGEKGPTVRDCDFAWRLSGNYLDVTIEEYAHIYDAIAYVKKVPILYAPYLVAPIKTKRQTGLLVPTFSHTQNLGNGITFPIFLALGPWHDLQLSPTWHDRADANGTPRGYHFGTTYRYIYNDHKKGQFGLNFVQRRFGDNRADPSNDDTSKPRLLGFMGEWAINFHNQYRFNDGSYSRQILRLVSDPYYTVDYGPDVGANDGTPSLRSQITFAKPWESRLFTSSIVHHQPLVVSVDSGIDRGAVTQLPRLTFSQVTKPISKYFSFEYDIEFNNYTRPGLGFDSIPTGFDPSTVASGDDHSAPNSTIYKDGDYIRTGRRLQIEPRIVASIPMPRGFKLQPVLSAGTLIYHFDFPESSFSHSEYSNIRIPVSMYLSRTYETNISGFEKIKHVLQPRIIYGKSLYRRRNDDHPFFQEGGSLQNPRFDIKDQFADFEFFRFELINRFRRVTENGVERFFLLQISEQYNSITTPNTQYAQRLGPIEVFGSARLGNFEAQMEARFDLEETTTPTLTREHDFSATIAYKDPKHPDYVSLNSRFSLNADDALSESALYLRWYKKLPLFFDIGGSLEYDFRGARPFRAYELSLFLGVNRRSCWNLILTQGLNSRNQTYFNLRFNLDFGSA